MSTDEYVPSEDDVCNVYVDYYMQHSGKTHSEANAEFVRFIERYTARVRRDAARAERAFISREARNWAAINHEGGYVREGDVLDAAIADINRLPETED